MSSGMRDAYGGRMFGSQKGGDVDISPRGIAISEFYTGPWNPGRIGPLLTALYDAGVLTRISSHVYGIPKTDVTVDCTESMAKVTGETDDE